MSYKEEIKRLGKFIPINDNPTGNLTKIEIDNIGVTIGAKLPNDYTDFLLNFGMGSFENNIGFKPIKEDSEYIHPEKTGIPNFKFYASSISVFFGIHEKRIYDILDNFNTYLDRSPNLFLPILTDGLGNLIGILLDKENYGKIYFWDHESEWDEDDYLDDTGQEMPEEAKFQNLWLLADNFTDFLKRCSAG
ncbi:SMI1/KNR4 family protein [uncultured Aquimarina sp.]|uniref:SMI1/KNR4 family protein n=1 Tax=uncultured Aquimarina sp. TaxID=575652 RepID=UPI002637D179|nr:SMI1/KNR4 family protein [uncultured Aquimarina sp.]